MSVRLRAFARSSGVRPALSCRVESLEQRALLSVSFTPGPYATPTNRTDLEITPTPQSFPESVIKINPLNPANIALAAGSAAGVSVDGGASHSPPTFFPLPPGSIGSNGDPDLTFDAAGRLFFTNLVAFPGAGTRRVGVVQLDPLTAGVIGAPSILPGTPGQRNDDKQFFTADANPASPFANNLYIVWDRFGVTPDEWEVYFAHSSDQGQTWSTPIQLSDFNGPNNIPGDADDEGFAWPADVGVAPNGDVYVTYHSQPDMNAFAVEVNGLRRNPNGVAGKTIVRRSTDGGLTFRPTVEAFPAGASDVTYNTQDALNGGNIAGTQFLTIGSASPYVLPDPARPGNIYVVNNDDPDNVHGSGDEADIVIARSTDHGATWTRSTVIAGPANSFQLFPCVAIDRFGNIAMAWYDNRRGLTNSDGRFLMDFMATYSTDGGLTSAPEFRLSDRPFDPDPDPVIRYVGPPPTTRIGEYFGIDLLGGTAHVSFDANYFAGGSVPLGQALVLSSFAIPGALTVSGDDGGSAAADAITVRPLGGNGDFVEVLVNGQRQYAGLFEGLSGISVDAGGATDTIAVSATGAALPVTVVPSSGDDAVNVNAASVGAALVHFSGTQRIGALSIGAGGLVRMPADGGRVLTDTSIAVTGTGRLEMFDNNMIVDYTGGSPIAQVQSLLAAGYNGGAWTGAGIASSSAAASGNTAIGYAEATDLFTAFPATFAAQQVDDTSVLLRHTLYGDADLNRIVNLNDFNRLAANFGQSGRRWSQGDFDFNTVVNLNDFNRLAASFGMTLSRHLPADDSEKLLV